MILIEKRFDEKRFLKKFRGFYSERKKILGFKKKSHDFYTEASLKYLFKRSFFL